MALISVGIAVFEVIYVDNVAGDLIENIEKIRSLCENEENDRAEVLLNSTSEKWQESKRLMKIFLIHDKAEDVTENLREMQERIYQEEREEFYSLCEKTKGQLAFIKENELPGIDNIL